MALNDTLKALGQIVLGQIELSENLNERKKQISSKFSGLTTIEIEDLSRIPPNRYALYTRTIINGEANILEKHFPLTFALLEKYFEKVIGKQLNRFDLVKKMLGKYPWKEIGTPSLSESLINYIKDDLRDICKSCPYLISIVELETFTMKCFRQKDDSISKDKILTAKELTALTVGEIEELDFFIPFNVEFLTSDYDIVNYREQFFKNGKTLPDTEPKSNNSFYIGSRDSNFIVRWNLTNSELFSYLKSKPRNELCSVSELAECFMTSHQNQKSPAELFSLFFETLISLIKQRAIVVTAH
jgi:hypothetical protein